MLNTSCEKLRKRESLRETLQFLRNEAKDRKCAEELKALLGDGKLLTELLSEGEPKVRKNAALLIGDLRLQQVADALWEAYNRETTLFVKSSYLTALGRLEVSDFSEQLKGRMEELLKVLKSKKYTYNKLNRMLIHILLGTIKPYRGKQTTYFHRSRKST